MTAVIRAPMDRPRLSTSSTGDGGEDITGTATTTVDTTINPRSIVKSPVLSENDIEYEDIDETDNPDEVEAEYWDPYLYKLQQEAPIPIKVVCAHDIPDRPDWFGNEYHGSITRDETSRLLGKEDGRYLVRQGLSKPGTYSLSFVFDQNVRHYHLHFKDGEYFVGETTFDDMEDLVADGLITLHMERHNVEEYLKTARESTSVRRSMYQPNRVEPPMERRHTHDVSQPRPPPLPPRNRGSFSKSPISPQNSDGHNNDVYINVQPKIRSVEKSNFHYEKPHNFKIHTFYNLPWCDYCHNFLWGLKKQGFKCKDCGYVTHKQCKDEAPSDCQPTRQLVKRVYGVDLTTFVKTHNAKVPVIVEDCINELEQRGLGLEGLYRVPGKSLEVLQIKKCYDQELKCDFNTFPDTHAVAGALKLYFRELPIPLITFDCYELVLVAARCSKGEQMLETIQVILKRLPLAHYNSLRFLMNHLSNVCAQKDENKMDSKNLAVVFAPSIIRPPANYDELLGMMKLAEQKTVTEALISHYSSLFRWPRHE